MLFRESFQKVLVFTRLLASRQAQIALKGMVSRQVANNAEYLTALSLALKQGLLAVLELALKEHADLHFIQAEHEVADDDLRGKGALRELATFIIVEDRFWDLIFRGFSRLPFPEIASRVIFLPLRRGKPHSDKPLVVDQIPSEVATLIGGLVIDHERQRDI